MGSHNALTTSSSNTDLQKCVYVGTHGCQNLSIVTRIRARILELSGFNWLILSKLTAALSFWAPIGFSQGWRNIDFSCCIHLGGNISFQNRVSTGQTVNCCVKILLFVLNSFHNNGEKVTWWKVWEKVIGSGQNLCFLSPAKGLFPWFEIRDETVRLIFYCSSIYVCFNSFVNAFSACSVNKMCLLQRKECGELLPLVVQEWADMKLEDAVG